MWFLCIHVTKVEMAKDNKTDELGCYSKQPNPFKERMSYTDKTKARILASNWVTNSLTASFFFFAFSFYLLLLSLLFISCLLNNVEHAVFQLFIFVA